MAEFLSGRTWPQEMLIAHTESSHGWGGQEIRVLTESRALIRRGHQVIVLADADSLIAQRATDYEVPVHRLRLKKKRFAEILAMAAAIDGLRPDLISTHSSTDHWVVAVAGLFTQHKPAVIRTRHVSAPVSRGIGTRWLYRSACAAIVTTGESIRAHLTHDGLVPQEKVFSIPTGIDLNFFKSTHREQARARIKSCVAIDDDSLLFGNIATLRSWKGQHDLIQAFALVAAELPQAKLLIVGDGPQAESLRALVASLGLGQRVLFAGHQSDVRDYFDALDVFVFPSYANEGIPQAILQAMAYGLAIITTTAGAIEEAVAGYPAANIVAPRDVAQLADAMRGFGRQMPGRVSLPDAIYQRIDIDAMTHQMVAVYERVLREKAARSATR
jgi:glycosyltransferase involved in cell wall biosynthesis